MGIFPKYALVLLAMVGGGILATGALEMASLYREIRDSREAIQRSEVKAAAARIQQYLTIIAKQIVDVADLPWDAPHGQAPNRRNEYHRLMKLAPAIAEIRHVDSRDRQQLAVFNIEPDQAESTAPVRGVEIVREARSKGVAYGPVYFRDGSEPYVTLAVRESAPGLEVTIAELNLKFVGQVLAQIGEGRSGPVYVVDSNFRLVAHPDPRMVLRNLDLSGHEALHELRQRMTASGESVGGMIEAPGLDGAPAVLSSAEIPAARWMVVAEQSRADVFRPVWLAIATTGSILAGGLAVALVVAFYMARRLTRPILELKRGADEIGRGDLGTRISVESRDEIAVLAERFNHMAEQLQEHTVGLERKVGEKTAELQDALALAHRAMRARALFLAAASHDLRQPLYAISILADTLMSEPLHASSAQVLEKQRQAIAVLRALFDNLLDLSRFDAGEIRPLLRIVALRELLAPSVLEHEVTSHARGLKFECEIDQAWVYTDPDLVRRVASNLLSNAVRYTPSGVVRLTAKADASRILVTVSDTGIGIEPADQSRVFEEFVQVSNPARDREKGVGLGLSIVQRIAQLLEMDLRLASQPGRGTTVTFAIPVAVGVDRTSSQEDLSYAATGAFKGLRIWIVEDDPLVRDALSLQFNSWDALPAFACSVAEILSLREADGRWPDAAIVDDMLGADESGLEIATMLAELMVSRRVVLVTGNVDPARTEVLESSGLVVLRKPLASSDLAQWLRDATSWAEEPTASRVREPAE